ncbi:TPA: hypothetical protein ACRRXW_000447 [Morganella morganii]
MQPVSTGQNVRLTGYISYQGTDAMIDDLKESASVKQSGLSERFTEIRNSAAEFFTAVKGKINNVFEPLGNLINKIAIREDKTQPDANQGAQMVLEVAQEKVPVYLDEVREFLDTNTSLDAASLVKFSGGTLRPLVTFLTGMNKLKGADKPAETFMPGFINKVNSLLSAAAGCGLDPSEPVNQLASISDIKKAQNYLDTKNFEQDFKARMMTLMKDIEKSILPDLLSIKPSEVIAPHSQQQPEETWRRLPDN